MSRSALLLVISACLMMGLNARAQEPGTRKTTVIKAARLIDTRAGKVLTDQAILIEGQRIKAVGKADEIAKQAGDASVIPL